MIVMVVSGRSIPRPLYAAGPDDGNVADDVGQRPQHVLAVIDSYSIS